MVLVNPFSPRALSYLSIDLNTISGSLIRLAIARAREDHQDKYLELDERDDAVSLFLLFQSLAQKPHAPEVGAALSAYEHLTKERLMRMFSDETLAQMQELLPILPLPSIAGELPISRSVAVAELGVDVPREDLYRMRSQRKGPVSYAVLWNDVYDVTDITKEYLVGSYLLVTKGELIELYARVLKARCAAYIKSLAPKMEGIKHPVYEKIASMVKTLVNVATPIEHASGSLEEGAFPPCIALALSGVAAGLRNYGITILLTSFLSYARLIPSTKIFDRDASFTLSQEDIQVLIEEVIPEIYRAGDRCDPPFFKEQPLERLNILYHLGFGMTDNPRPEDYGKSKWYLPPSCAKVAENAPQLCQPDDYCRRVVWVVLDREKCQEVVEKARERGKEAGGERVLSLLLKGPKTLADLSETTGIDERELGHLMGTMAKNKLVIRRKITNPLIYYIRRKRMLSQKP
jgi:DNA primase large subunit